MCLVVVVVVVVVQLLSFLNVSVLLLFVKMLHTNTHTNKHTSL